MPELRHTARVTARETNPPRIDTGDGRLDLTLITPNELGGAGGDGVSPEELLAAGYAACLLSALRYEALRHGGDIRDAEVTATAELAGEQDRFGVRLTLEAKLPSLPEQRAREIFDAACAAWPYAKERPADFLQVRLASGAAASDRPDDAEVHGTPGLGRGYG